MSNWKKIAKKVEEDYGAEVDYDEEYFICPECGEPIYSQDWTDSDFDSEGFFCCPVCGNEL